MRKIFLFFIVFLLAACSDYSTESKWVAQSLPTKEKERPVAFNGKVNIYTPTSNTVGYVIKQQERDKWILVNAQQIASHPYSLVQEELLNLGETHAIDVENNMAIVHIRNSFDYSVVELSTFKTTKNNNEIIASKEQIDALLNEAVEKKINWQQRLQKNNELLQQVKTQPIDNFTKYYSKNIFTFNEDELKQSAIDFMEELNRYIQEKDETILMEYIHSDDVLHELQFMNNEINGFEIKEARKEGMYYFVNGMEEQKKDIRLTFVKEQQKYKLIGANFLSDEQLQQQKIPHLQLTDETTIQSVPALQMFLNANISSIKLAVGELVWQLEHSDKRIEVKNGSTKFSCSSISVTENNLVLNDCKNTKKENFIIARFK